MVVNDAGHGVPVAWLIHKYNDNTIIRDFFDALAMETGREGLPVPFPLRANTPAGRNIHLFSGCCAALSRFCPSHIIIDVAGTEIAAVNESMWGRGVQTYAYVDGRHVRDATASVEAAKIVYCDWHLKCAWGATLRSYVKDSVVREDIMNGLKTLVALTVRLAPLLGLCSTVGLCSTRAHTLRPRRKWRTLSASSRISATNGAPRSPASSNISRHTTRACTVGGCAVVTLTATRPTHTGSRGQRLTAKRITATSKRATSIPKSTPVLLIKLMRLHAAHVGIAGNGYAPAASIGSSQPSTRKRYYAING